VVETQVKLQKAPIFYRNRKELENQSFDHIFGKGSEFGRYDPMQDHAKNVSTPDLKWRVQIISGLSAHECNDNIEKTAILNADLFYKIK